jgi:hypothetical protein
VALLFLVMTALLGLYVVFFLPAPLFRLQETFQRYAAVLMSLIAIAVVVPYGLRAPGEERFAIKLLWRLFITGVFTGILIGGVSLVLLMLEQLLDINLGRFAYRDNAFLCFGLFAPSFFLAGIPQRVESIGEEPFQPLLRVLFGYIIYPLLSVYTAIVYVYFIRMLLLWTWPNNMLVNMVLWYTTIGVVALYCMRSENMENRWFRFFDRWYPRATLLPLVLMFTSLVIRLNAYGFTEARYFVLVLGVWVTCITVLAILNQPEKRPNRVAPILFSVVALFAVLSPWNAFSVAKLSQNVRLEGLLERNGMLSAAGTLQAGTNVAEQDQREQGA